MWRLSLSALLVAALVPAATSARPATQKPGRPLLTYVPPSGGLCLVRANGTHRVRLFAAPRDVDSPAWSPSGRVVAFTQRHPIALAGIVFANARGQQLWGVAGAGASWSPDGRHISYYEGSASPPWWYRLVVARPRGAERVVIGGSMEPRGDAVDPTFAPDGRRLAFSGTTHGPDAVGGIYSVPVEGGDWRLLVRDAGEPAYSPDGTKLAYVASGGIFVADADGQNPRLIAAGPSAYWPRWSPDGSLVAFERLDLFNGHGWEVAVAKADGTGERVVASGLSFPQGPSAVVAWSPGGKLIAFYRGDRTLVVTRADGTGTPLVVARVRQFTEETPPAWRPPVALPRAKRSRC